MVIKSSQIKIIKKIKIYTFLKRNQMENSGIKKYNN